MTTHVLKIWPIYYDPILDGRKTFEVRRNDRFYKIGDILELREISPLDAEFTKRVCHVKVKYVCDLPGVTGYVGMSVEVLF